MTEESQVAEATPPGSKKKKKLLVLVVMLVILLAGGGAAAWFFFAGGNADPAAAKEAPPKPPVYLPLETFTVNLHDGEQYLQVDLTLEATEQAELDTIKLHMPRIRSRLLTLLAHKTADELLRPEGKDQLAKEILAEINKPLDPKGKPQNVADVLFTSFVIQ
jgi:flagellar FliL protein